MDLVPYIYHEVQDTGGSMLCAQHALNNLLGQQIYTAQDLADLALTLDEQENAQLGPEEQRGESQNMDDTGYFSLSVLENALQIYGLTLISWRSEAMAPFHSHPESQSAFILNLASHWLPLRRFPPPPTTPSRWYNLNSFLPHPTWISDNYLNLVLAQAEEEGYSVFVVRDLEGGVGRLPEGEADRMVLGMGEGAGSGGGALGGGARRNFASSSSSYATAAASASSSNLSDPVAASLARSQAQLLNFQRQQAAAAAEAMEFSPHARRQRRQPDLGEAEAEEEQGPLAGAGPRNRFERQRAEEEEELRKAIEESLRDARGRGEQVDPGPAVAGEGSGAGMAQQPARGQPIALPSAFAPIHPIDPEQPNNDNQPPPPAPEEEDEPEYDFLTDRRFYDDEDADLQAALRASLMDAPVAGVVVPDVGEVRRASQVVEEKEEEKEKEEEVEKVEEEEEEEPVVEELSPEELRRRRLERFK